MVREGETRYEIRMTIMKKKKKTKKMMMVHSSSGADCRCTFLAAAVFFLSAESLIPSTLDLAYFLLPSDCILYCTEPISMTFKPSTYLSHSETFGTKIFGATHQIAKSQWPLRGRKRETFRTSFLLSHYREIASEPFSASFLLPSFPAMFYIDPECLRIGLSIHVNNLFTSH